MPGPDDAHPELSELYAADRKEHADVPPVGTPEYRQLRDRDRARRTRAAELLRALRDGPGLSSLDLYRVAWLFNHGDDSTDARQAHELALEAAERGHGPARWLAAAAHDRWCMYEGRAQKYGTQFVPDGKRYRLWDVDPETTDEERRQWDVPPLAEQLQRAEELTRRQSQPPMDDAPDWLRAAIKRWRSRGIGSLRREVSRRRVEKVSAGPAPSGPLTDGVVTLRLPTLEDVARFACYGSDEALLEGTWIVGPQGAPVEQWATDLVAELRAGWTPAGGDHGGGLVIDEAEPCVGTVDFLPRQPGHVELTYGVAPPWRGRDIATRAAELAARWALAGGGFDCVELRIAESHPASRRVAEKAGFACLERFETFVEGTGLTHIDCLYVRRSAD